MTAGVAIAVYVQIVNETATHQNTGLRLKPVSRHSTVTIITEPIFMRKRLCSFIDDFPLESRLCKLYK